MTVLNDVLNIILKFFPKEKEFNKSEYQGSNEFQRLLELRRRYLQDQTLSLNLQQKLKAIFRGYAVVDWTNFQDANSYEYKILLHKNQPILDDDLQLMKVLGGSRTDLRLFISILGKYYYFFVEETLYEEKSAKWSFHNINQFSTELRENINHMRRKLSSEGYTELTREDVNTIIEGIETDLVQIGKVKVFHCLFTDSVTP